MQRISIALSALISREQYQNSSILYKSVQNLRERASKCEARNFSSSYTQRSVKKE